MSDDLYATAATPAPAVRRRVSSVLTALGFLGMLGVVGYLLAERNHRTYRVERMNDHLVVLRGLMLPFGAEPYRPADRALADTYAPIPIKTDSPGDLLSRRFDDRDNLDRELFRTLAAWISARVAADSPDKLVEAVGYLRRAERLPGISEDQRRQLADLSAEAAYFEGRAKLEESLDGLKTAIERLEVAAGTRGRHAREAADLLVRVQDSARAAIRAARLATGAPAPLTATDGAAVAPATRPEATASPAPLKPAPAPGAGESKASSSGDED